jgi:hypothetical protein
MTYFKEYISPLKSFIFQIFFGTKTDLREKCPEIWENTFPQLFFEIFCQSKTVRSRAGPVYKTNYNDHTVLERVAQLSGYI